jgi:hypothetical protein
MSQAHATTSGPRAGKTITPVSLLAVFLALGCGNSGGNDASPGATGGGPASGGTTGAGGASSSGSGGVQPTGGLLATGGAASGGGVSSAGGVQATGGTAKTGGIAASGGSATGGGTAATGGSSPRSGGSTSASGGVQTTGGVGGGGRHARGWLLGGAGGTGTGGKNTAGTASGGAGGTGGAGGNATGGSPAGGVGGPYTPTCPTGGTYAYPFRNPCLSLEDRVTNLLGLLTDAEKVSLLTEHQPAISRLGIAAFSTYTEGIHGLGWAAKRPAILSTQFPQASGLGETWDPDVLTQAFAQVGNEARVYFKKYNGTHSAWPSARPWWTCREIRGPAAPRKVWARIRTWSGSWPRLLCAACRVATRWPCKRPRP